MTPSLFDADYQLGGRLISTWPNLCTAAHIRTLPGLADETDAEIERRILCGAQFLFYGAEDGRLVFWKNDVRDWLGRYCNGEAFNRRRPRATAPPPSGSATWYRGEMFDDLIYATGVRSRQADPK